VNLEYQEYFKRQIELFGEEKQLKLLKKKILIVGAGGLGCSVGIGLGGSGIGEIDFVDFDEVSFSNLHRQIAFGQNDLGNFKVQTLAKRIKEKNPFVKIKTFKLKFEEFIKKQTPKYDLILDATDNLQTRKEIDKWAKSSNTPWIYASVEEWRGQVCFFEKSSFEVFANKSHSPKGIAAPMVMEVGAFEANLALRYLVNLPIQKDTLFFMYYNNKGEYILKNFKMPT
jgi:adenylyltransferase/sulfurtransferase